ncbi:MAG: homocysteine S-methyltransferase family protein [Bacteroidota bacterium]|nr:homocysteine S-methyltransferase family protein [Bacteroidota bacterium]
MSFISCYKTNPFILMEGALGERLKREYDLQPDNVVAYANIIYRQGGKDALFELWNQYIDVAKVNNLPFLATTPTRRANKERVAKGGYDQSIILDNVSILKQLRDLSDIEMYIGGLMGCRGDAYKATESLQPTEAKEFHSWQADLLTQAGVDFLYAGIMPTLPEAIGMAMAMEQTKLPYIISFMLRDTGRLLDGTTINDAIEKVDCSVKRKPVCYMTNCIHPAVLYKALSWNFNQTPLVKKRFHGIQANTSSLTPEQLDNSKDLKGSDSLELAQAIYKLTEIMTLKIIGGCCGTDNTHISKIASTFSRKIDNSWH